MRAAPFQGRRAHSGIPTNAAVRKRAQRRCAPPLSKAAALMPEARPTPPSELAGNVSAADRRRSPRAFTPIAATVWSRSPRIRANCSTASAPFPAHSRQSLPTVGAVPPRIRADRGVALAPFSAHSHQSRHRFGAVPPAHSRQLQHRFGAVPPHIRADRGVALAPFPRAFTPIAAPLRRRPPAHSRQSLPPLRRRPPAHSRRSRHRFDAVPPHIHINRGDSLAPFSHAFAPIVSVASAPSPRPRAFTPIASAGWRRSPRQSLPPVCSTYANPPPSQGRGRVFAPWAGRMPRDGRRPALCRGGSGSPRHNRSGAFKTVGGCAHSARRRSPAPSMPEAPFPRLRRVVTPRRIPRGTRRSPSPCRSRGPRASGG